jgi:hypothetical protein
MCDCSRSALQVLDLHRVCDVVAGLKTIISIRMLKSPPAVGKVEVQVKVEKKRV